MNPFKLIYKYSLCGGGSGTGSIPKYNKSYINFVNYLIEDQKIKTILDIGCGDWQLGSQYELDNTDYIGIDVVDEVIQKNNDRYSKDNISFKYINILDNDEILNSEYDLIIIKDVMQHLSYKNIKEIISKIKNSKWKYLLLVNDQNSLYFYDIPNGGYRALNPKWVKDELGMKSINKFEYYEKIYLWIAGAILVLSALISVFKIGKKRGWILLLITIILVTLVLPKKIGLLFKK